MATAQADSAMMMPVKRPKQPVAYLAMKKKREAKQNSFTRMKSATRKFVRVSKLMTVRHMVTAHLHLGGNGFDRSARVVISPAKTSWM